MRVKEVSVQGFKSFANRHRFVFPSGITAVVGPNGSGKSNVADAIRWVLGEQRTSNLRAKRVDDMIFAGTARRARSGFAQVSVTFDNEDGWLDIDYPEVEIQRRASRDGSSQYTINGAQVRLRDVIDLLGGQLGDGNYTVIGQGLVDGALALRPEQRRSLVDEAAGLVPLQRKRDRSLRQLDKTDQNLTRVRDILAELGPRLRRMTRLAERAAQHREVADELKGTLADWYGFHWHRALDHRAETAKDEGERRRSVESAGAKLSELDASVQKAEQRSDLAETTLSEARSKREAFLRSDAASRQANAVALARLDGLRAREVELSEALTQMTEGLVGQRRRVDDGRAALEELEQAALAATKKAAEHRAALESAEAEREARAKSLEVQKASILRLESERAARERRASDLNEQVQDRKAADESAGEERGRLAKLAEAADAELEKANIALEQAEDVLDSATRELSELEAEQMSIGASLDAARESHSELRARFESLRARSDTIESLVGEIDQAGRVISRLETQGLGDSVLGSVAELLEVPEAWSSAAAIALGSAIHGVVLRVDEGLDLDRTLQLATADARGQVTLVALVEDDVPTARSTVVGERAVDVLDAPKAPGLVSALLADTLLVPDSETARTALRAEAWASRVATQSGVLHRRGGLLVSGAAERDLLELQRERRSLPKAIAKAETAADQAAREVDAIAAERRETEAKLGELTEARNAAARARSEQGRAVEAARGSAEQARRRLEWADEARKRRQDEIDALETEAKTIAEFLTESGPRLESMQQALSNDSGSTNPEEIAALRGELQAADAVANEASQTLAGRRAMQLAAASELGDAESRLQSDRLRSEALNREIQALESEISALKGRSETDEDVRRAVEEGVEPAEAEARESRLALRKVVSERDQLRRALTELESELTEARIASTRAEQRQERLYDQLRSDAEWLGLEAEEQLELGASLDVNLQRVEELSEDIEPRLIVLRKKMRAIGNIDRDALEAYEETVERNRMLTEQEADLVAAERDLRGLLDTLEAEMSERFNTTFDEVAAAFATFFPILFGGGEAELVLEGEEGSAPANKGLEIMARPPGKRLQPLSLLSGGERALTGVALVFSLLKVSRTPFVVLDEVDAALDEANVDRFCGALSTLAEDIQVVVITHNRSTIQTAGTVYGVTMADDGASQIISLNVESIRA